MSSVIRIVIFLVLWEQSEGQSNDNGLQKRKRLYWKNRYTSLHGKHDQGKKKDEFPVPKKWYSRLKCKIIQSKGGIGIIAREQLVWIMCYAMVWKSKWYVENQRIKAKRSRIAGACWTKSEQCIK